MSHQPSPPSHPIKPGGPKAWSSGVLVVEAAIATLVLSVFASSTPQLFTAQPSAPRATAAKTMHSPHNQLPAIHWSWNGPASTSPQTPIK